MIPNHSAALGFREQWQRRIALQLRLNRGHQETR